MAVIECMCGCVDVSYMSQVTVWGGCGRECLGTSIVDFIYIASINIVVAPRDIASESPDGI